MPLSIKNAETEKLAREVASLAGESLTDAIRKALEERRERLRRIKKGRSLAQELDEIALACSRLPVISTMTEDEILGYDEFGIPTR